MKIKAIIYKLIVIHLGSDENRIGDIFLNVNSSQKCMALPKEVIAPVQRCPKCLKLTLSFDPATRRIVCSSCGYEALLKGGKR